MKVSGIPTVRSASPERLSLPGESRSDASGPAAARSAPVRPRVPRAVVEAVNQAELNENVRKLNAMARVFNTNLQFSVHKATHRIVVKVLRSDTGEVLREIPPEKTLDAIASVEKALGLLVDERA